MEEETQNEEGSNVCKMKGMELILKSINCDKYKQKFDEYGLNENTMVHLTANDLRVMEVDDNDVRRILEVINVLNKTLSHTEVKLSNDDISRLQSNICGQLGTIVLVLNRIYNQIAKNKNNFVDVLIDDHLSSVDAALMVKPYMRAEEKDIENRLKHVFKIQKRRKPILVTTTVCAVFLLVGFTFRRYYPFTSVPK